ncbi:MAG TPA: tetratricopeptide repeat protein [Sphingobium sp.]|nr:tetratricopeptide repeat protein [Sphingobium sp.]
MKRSALSKAALSSLIVGTTMVGCTGAAFRPSAIAAPKQDSGRATAAIEKALSGRDGARAVAAAEMAVQAAPQDANYRQLLGRAYIASGRFVSAETALSDAMTLGNRDPRTIISLALVKVALGKNDAARELLATNADIVPASDYGLAMAMAGDPAEGVRILSEAIHDPSATGRTRQNLAYAYALAGRWKDARVVAGLDLDPLAANQRIAQWAQTAAPDFAQQRIAGLMGVTFDGSDAGQPVALALVTETAPVQMAEASLPEMPAAPVVEQTTQVAQAEMDQPPVDFTPYVAPAPVMKAPQAKMKSATARLSAPIRTAVPAREVARFDGKGNSSWVVQLGAYANTAVAKEKWYEMARRNSAISALPVLTSQITMNGVSYARLAVSGFDDRLEADALCRTIRARRGQCFVREKAPGAAPQRWALAAKPRQFASR